MAARAVEEKALEKARRAAEDEAYSDEDRQSNIMTDVIYGDSFTSRPILLLGSNNIPT